MRRLVLVAFVALGLAPGTWWRSPVQRGGFDAPLVVIRERVAPWSAGPLRLLGAWRLESRNRHFHGYSALLVLDDGRLLAGSDRGRKLLFPPPDTTGPPARFSLFAGDRVVSKLRSDLEALARDPGSGRIWAAYEGSNEIVRYQRNFGGRMRVAPRAMRNWPDNTGPEAMTRLADGRFIVLSEGDPSAFAPDMPGLLFPSDPLDDAEPVAFRFHPPAGFRPVDIAQLPDGRAIILLRRVDWWVPPGFASKLLVADPARIAAGEAWVWEPLADLAAPLPPENYEGLAVRPLPGGAAVVWLISDDNMMTLQRTLLLKLLWRPNAEGPADGASADRASADRAANDKARRSDRAPR